MLGAYHAEASYGEVCEWYDGYLFGTTEIFNPWSVISYISRKCVPQAYWINTGRNEILDEVLNLAAPDMLEKLEELLQGGKVIARIDMNVIYPSLKEDPSNIYSYLQSASGRGIPQGCEEIYAAYRCLYMSDRNSK